MAQVHSYLGKSTEQLHFFAIPHQLDDSCAISPSFYTDMYWCCHCFYLPPSLSHSVLALPPPLPTHTCLLAEGERLKWMHWANVNRANITVFSPHQSPCSGQSTEVCPGMKLQPGHGIGMRLVAVRLLGSPFPTGSPDYANSLDCETTFYEIYLST